MCRVTDPEVKRKIIGDTFVNVAHRIITEMALDPKKVFLGQVRRRIRKEQNFGSCRQCAGHPETRPDRVCL